MNHRTNHDQPKRRPIRIKFGGKWLEFALFPLEHVPNNVYQFEITIFNRWNVSASFWVRLYDFRDFLNR